MLNPAGFYDALLHVMYVVWLLFVGGTPYQLKNLHACQRKTRALLLHN